MKVYPENKKHDLCVISIENQFLVSFSLDPALYYATPRHDPRSDLKKNGLKLSARLEGKKVMKFQREKITTGWDITKNVEGGWNPPPSRHFFGLIIIVYHILSETETWPFLRFLRMNSSEMQYKLQSLKTIIVGMLGLFWYLFSSQPALILDCFFFLMICM